MSEVALAHLGNGQEHENQKNVRLKSPDEDEPRSEEPSSASREELSTVVLLNKIKHTGELLRIRGFKPGVLIVGVKELNVLRIINDDDRSVSLSVVPVESESALYPLGVLVGVDPSKLDWRSGRNRGVILLELLLELGILLLEQLGSLTVPLDSQEIQLFLSSMHLGLEVLGGRLLELIDGNLGGEFVFTVDESKNDDSAVSENRILVDRGQLRHEREPSSSSKLQESFRVSKVANIVLWVDLKGHLISVVIVDSNKSGKSGDRKLVHQLLVVTFVDIGMGDNVNGELLKSLQILGEEGLVVKIDVRHGLGVLLSKFLELKLVDGLHVSSLNGLQTKEGQSIGSSLAVVCNRELSDLESHGGIVLDTLASAKISVLGAVNLTNIELVLELGSHLVPSVIHGNTVRTRGKVVLDVPASRIIRNKSLEVGGVQVDRKSLNVHVSLLCGSDLLLVSLQLGDTGGLLDFFLHKLCQSAGLCPLSQIVSLYLLSVLVQVEGGVDIDVLLVTQVSVSQTVDSSNVEVVSGCNVITNFLVHSFPLWCQHLAVAALWRIELDPVGSLSYGGLPFLAGNLGARRRGLLFTFGFGCGNYCCNSGGCQQQQSCDSHVDVASVVWCFPTLESASLMTMHDFFELQSWDCGDVYPQLQNGECYTFGLVERASMATKIWCGSWDESAVERGARRHVYELSQSQCSEG